MPFASQRSRRRAARTRRLQLESLEVRCLLSATDGRELVSTPAAETAFTPAAALASAGGGFNQFEIAGLGRWTSTATDAGPLGQGDATTLTWGVVPDGTFIAAQPAIPGDTDGDSDLQSFLGGLYGTAVGGVDQQPWFSFFTSVFDRYSEVSGITYVFEPMDDGAALDGTAPGVLGTRPDIRLGGHMIDGEPVGGSIIGYTSFPQVGDTIFDTGDTLFFGDTQSNSLPLRNFLAHEHGHGVGLDHVSPNDSTKLMETEISLAIDGPQHDDILGLQRLYGDPREKNGGNDTIDDAWDIGTLTVAGTTIGNQANEDYLSIDDDADTDFFSFTLTTGFVLDVTLAPVGQTYLSGPEGTAGTSFNSLAQSDLTLAVIDSDMSTILGTANLTALGETEMLTDLMLTDPGEYYVRVTGTADAAQFYQLTLSGEEIPTPLGSIAGTKWNDLDGDGTQQPGEAALAGWTIFLDDGDGVLEAGERSTTTAADGSYTIAGLDAGTYTVAEVQQSGWEQTFPVAGTHSITLAADQMRTGVDFGNRLIPSTRASISGAKWNDLSADGIRDAGEPGLAGWTIFLDDGDGILETGERSAVTAADGSYTIGDLDAGSYTVAEVSQPGWTQTAPAAGTHSVTVADGEAATGFDFGNFQPQVAAGEGVWLDVNADGIRDPGEGPLGGMRGFIDLDGDGLHSLFEPATHSDELGNFTFSGVAAGNYSVVVPITPGYLRTFPTGTVGANIAIDAAGLATGGAFGFQAAFDYGDATDTYKTLSASGGPVHGILPGFQLGAAVDAESDGQPVDVVAGGDGDDEDGVVFLSGLQPDTVAEVIVTVSQGDYSPGRLQGWIDFNADGDFDDPGEQIFSNVAVVDGANNLFFDVPGTAAFDPDNPTTTTARFRFGYEYGLGPDGPALAGEVEDYTDLTLPQPADSGVNARNDFFPLDPTMPILEGAAGQAFDLLANDDNNAGGTLSISMAGPGSAGGTIDVAPDGQSVTYTPMAGFFGTETFPYTATNGDVSDAATVSVTVTAVNDNPNARDDSYNVAVDSTDQILTVVADNDTDPDGDMLMITGVGPTDNGGMVTPSADGQTLTYTPMAGFNGLETFTYTVSDGNTGTDTATVRVQVGTIVPVDPTASFNLLTTNLAGTPIGSVAQGETFLLQGFVQDVGDAPVGIFSAYLDVLYEEGLVSVVRREKQVITLTGAPSTGSFTLTFDGETTDPIELDAMTSADDVRTALEALSNIPVDSLSVVQRADDLLQTTWEVQFGGSFAGSGVANMTADGSGLTGGTNPDAVVTVASTADPADPLSLFGSFTFGDAYQKARFVDADASECSDASRSCFNELGAVDGSTPLGALPQLLFQVYLQADATGTVTFAGEPADELPLHQVGRFGIDEGIPFTDIDYGATTLTITGAAPAASGPAASGPTTASADRHDVNGDGVVSPIDALIVINDLNRYGARSLLASSPLAFDGGSDMRAMDVNDDGYLSSIDALMVINFLDREPVSADAPPATIHRDPVEAPLAAEAPVATIESTSATEAEQPLVGAAIGGVERASDEAGPAAERDELPPTRATSPTAPTAAVDPRQGATQTARQGLPTARQTALDLEPILDEIAGDITRSGGW